MPSSITMSGVAGSVRWGYRTVADLRDWTLAHEAGARILTATVVRHDAFGLSQRPLTFTAPYDGGAWTWRVETLQMEGASLTAVLGPRG